MNDLKNRISKLNNYIVSNAQEVIKNGDTNLNIFDYDPEDRYKVQDYLYNFISFHAKDKILIIDIYNTIIEILQEIDYIDIVIEDEKNNGLAYANKIIQSVLGIGTRNDDLLKNTILEKINNSNKDIIILTGLEGCYQIIRGHTILSILESNISKKLIIMFYPGTYDGQTFKLFNKLGNDNGYNATIIAGRQEI